MSKEKDEKFSDKEAKRRFDAMLKGAMKSPPKPLKDVSKKKASETKTPPKRG